MREVPVEYLRECFDYDPQTGVLTWKMRPRSHFSSVGVWRWFNAKFSGHVVGTRNHQGYRIVVFIVGGVKRRFGCHCIAWVLVTGVWPLDEIDHRNGEPSDNRFVNLREGTHAENMQNQKLAKNNVSGFRGVC
jgi:hypothetical protein